MKAVQQTNDPLAFWIQCHWDQNEWAIAVDWVYNFHNGDRGPKAAQKRAESHINLLVQDKARADPVVVHAKELGAQIGHADLNEELGTGTWVLVTFSEADKAALFKLTYC